MYKRQVRVSLTRSDKHARIAIKDSGCGMDDAFIRERLFRPFDTTKGDTGMGIGAYECREYVYSLNGELEVDSTIGQGTAVCITLPMSAQEEFEHRHPQNMESVG